MNRIITLFFIMFVGFLVYSQSAFLLNYSFEDELHFGISPKEWTTCNAESTPDIQPGHVGINLTASHGNSYLGLVMRGTKYPKPKSESVQAELIKALEKGKTYNFGIDLAAPGAYEEHCGRKTIEYNDMPKLKFLGIRNDCGQADLLYETQFIENKDWLTYSFEIKSENDYNYIKLENSFDANKASYIICDNFQISEISEDKSKVQNIDLTITNVITPNSDGNNDFFKIDNLPDNSKLVIFDKNQNLVYLSNNYKNNWEGVDNAGKILASGTYFYKLKVSYTVKDYVGFVVIKRE